MKLTLKALNAINNTKTRLTLGLAMGFTEAWIIRLIDVNKDNGPLTTAKALSVITEQTGLSQDAILEDSISEKVA